MILHSPAGLPNIIYKVKYGSISLYNELEGNYVNLGGSHVMEYLV